ncbi:MAG TPA: response regulator [Anaerolineales bacterium]|jgi:DNA-binding response OmpR family regulator
MRTVWIVDDDDEMSHAVTLMLKLLEWQVRTFHDARSASKLLLAGERPDVLLLDINMPEVSGIDMLEFVRRRNELNDLPVIMLSSETTDLQVDEAMDLGASAYIFKPVMIDELEAALQKVARPA